MNSCSLLTYLALNSNAKYKDVLGVDNFSISLVKTLTQDCASLLSIIAIGSGITVFACTFLAAPINPTSLVVIIMCCGQLAKNYFDTATRVEHEYLHSNLSSR